MSRDFYPPPPLEVFPTHLSNIGSNLRRYCSSKVRFVGSVMSITPLSLTCTIKHANISAKTAKLPHHKNKRPRWIRIMNKTEGKNLVTVSLSLFLELHFIICYATLK